MVCVVVVGVGPFAAEEAVPALLVGAVVVDAGTAGVVVPQAVMHSVAAARPTQVIEAIRREYLMVILPIRAKDGERVYSGGS
jgi:hypothetical protein